MPTLFRACDTGIIGKIIEKTHLTMLEVLLFFLIVVGGLSTTQNNTLLMDAVKILLHISTINVRRQIDVVANARLFSVLTTSA